MFTDIIGSECREGVELSEAEPPIERVSYDGAIDSVVFGVDTDGVDRPPKLHLFRGMLNGRSRSCMLYVLCFGVSTSAARKKSSEGQKTIVK